MKNNELGWLALMVLLALAGGMLAKAVMDYRAVKSLPVPPDFTAAEMRQREVDFIGDHLQTCKRCGPASAETEFYCDEYLRLSWESKIVGNWRMIGVVKQTNRVIWEYIGRPYPGWVWSELLQCWRQVRNYR